ncbi:hypothetical protein TNCV_2616661 [Trichonephila clavipes]|nr:hypothetical protein TNCV_2616661 [Trichonephila clavipes]
MGFVENLENGIDPTRKPVYWCVYPEKALGSVAYMFPLPYIPEIEFLDKKKALLFVPRSSDCRTAETTYFGKNICGEKCSPAFLIPAVRRCQFEAHEIHHDLDLRCTPVISCSFEQHTCNSKAWLLTRPARSAAMPNGMATTCSNALDSMNALLTTSSVGTERLGAKWSRSQAWVLDK